MRMITFAILTILTLAACVPMTRRPVFGPSTFEERDLVIQVVDADTRRPVPDVEVEKILVMTVPGTLETEYRMLARKHTSAEGVVSFHIDQGGIVFKLRKRGYRGNGIFPTPGGYADTPPEPDEQNGRITVPLKPRS